MRLRPLQDRIIVKRLEEETKTAGGILIPDTAKEKPQRGEIVAVGKGKETEDGKVLPDGRQSRRQGAFRQICRHRNKDRRRRLSDHARRRHPRRRLNRLNLGFVPYD